MDKKLWKQKYKKIPRFVCPRCGDGRLVQKKGYEIRLYEPNWISHELDEASLRGERSIGRFVGFLHCDVEECDETATICGDYVSDSTAILHEFGHGYDIETTTEYKVSRLTPMPHVIALPDAMTQETREQIENAFELLFVDAGACANRLRVAVERLLDDLVVNQGALSKRIDTFEALQPGHKGIFDALRFVGNVASHEGMVAFEDVLTCFELLEAAIAELTGKRTTNLQALAANINSRRGNPVP